MKGHLIGPLLCGGLLIAAPASTFAGDPIGGVGVGVETSPGGITKGSATTDDKGIANLGRLEPGTYVVKWLTGDSKGKVFRTLKVEQAGPLQIAVPIVTPTRQVFATIPGSNLSKNRDPAAPSYRIFVDIPGVAAKPAAGKTVDPPPPIQGDPLPGIDVSMEQHPTGIIIASSTTNNAGQLAFNPTQPGTFLLRHGRGPYAGQEIGIVNLKKAGVLKITVSGWDPKTAR
jgi:hypothetical protein